MREAFGFPDATTSAYFVVVLFAAYLVRGMAGFGSGLIALPLLSLVFPLPLVVPIVVLLDYLGSASQGLRNVERIVWREQLVLIPFMCIGVGGGLYAVANKQAVPQQFPTLLGLVWLAVLVTFGVRSNIAALLAGCAVAAAVWGAVMHRYTDAAFPWWDGTVAMLSVAAQILMSRRYLENWVLWIAVDVLAIPLFAVKALGPTAFLYAIFLALSIWGLMQWARVRARVKPARES